MAEVVGRNARFMQGPDSDPEAIAELRDAVRTGRATVVELINLRKDGTRFWNQVGCFFLEHSRRVVEHSTACVHASLQLHHMSELTLHKQTLQ